MVSLYFENGNEPYIIEKNGIITGVSESFSGLTEYPMEVFLNKSIAQMISILKMGPEIKIKNFDQETEYFLFTKSLDVRFVNIEIIKEANEIIYTFREKSNSRLEERFNYPLQLLAENIIGISIYSVPDFTMLKANQVYLDFCDAPFNIPENTFGKSIYDIIMGYKDSPIEAIIKHTLVTGKSEYLKELQYDKLARGITYWDQIITPIVEKGNVKYIIINTQDVTEKVIYRENLKQQNAVLKRQTALLDLSGEAIYAWDLYGSIVYWNKGAELMYGYSSDEVIGCINHVLLKTLFPSGVTNITSVLDKYRVWSGEIENTCKDGRKIIIQTRKQVMVNDLGEQIVLANDRNITESKVIEQALKDSEEKYRQLFEHMTNGFGLYEVILNENGEPIDFKYLMVNNAFHKIMNLNPNLLVGKTIKEINPEADENMIKTYCMVGLTGEPFYHEYYSKTFNRYFSVYTFSPKIGQFASVFDDISERKQYELDLILAKESAETANKAKSQFLANMSHEIRTPMNGVLGMAQILEMSLDGENKKMVEMIYTSGNDLLKIINDILDLSKIEAGKVRLTQEKFNIYRLIDEINNIINHLSSQKGLEYICDIDRKIQGDLCGDPDRLKQILFNLLGNAIKFTESGKIELSVRIAKVFEDKLQLVFLIKDTGIGISEDKMGQLFTFFMQADESATKKYGGTGLGLAISKQLINMMGGEICVESKLGSGSEFSFNIILALNKEEMHKNADIGELTQTAAVHSYALLVEDDYVSGVIMETFCGWKGIQLKIVLNGDQALDVLKNETFDFIFMDIQMPDKNGYEVTKAIRDIEKPLYKHTPIIATTAYALLGDRQKCIDAGMDDYIEKPINAEKLYSIIEKYI